jgi:hypothetical protein
MAMMTAARMTMTVAVTTRTETIEDSKQTLFSTGHEMFLVSKGMCLLIVFIFYNFLIRAKIIFSKCSGRKSQLENCIQ